jgi:nicotinamidase-related amidase
MPAKRIDRARCCGALIDVQTWFLAQLDEGRRARILADTRSLVRLLAYFRIPLVVTLERPVERKGGLPEEIARHLGPAAEVHEKDFFDLTREEPIAARLEALARPQVVLAGCETDVCVLQSCLGLLDRGHEVFVVEDLLFSSSREVGAAIERMKAAGAVLVRYKTLFYELMERVEESRRTREPFLGLGPFPEDLPDTAGEEG